MDWDEAHALKNEFEAEADRKKNLGKMHQMEVMAN